MEGTLVVSKVVRDSNGRGCRIQFHSFNHVTFGMGNAWCQGVNTFNALLGSLCKETVDKGLSC